MKPTTPTEPFFTEMDFNPAFDGHLSSVKAAQFANAKIQPLVDENTKLRAALEECVKHAGLDDPNFGNFTPLQFASRLGLIDMKAKAALSGKGDV